MSTCDGARLALAFTLLLVAADARAHQTASTGSPAVRAFIDCIETMCDQEFFRTEIAFVDHVHERQDADVHILITSQATGAGGKEITFSFYGQARFSGRDQVVRRTFLVAASDDTVRREMVRVISLGLVPYALESSVLDDFTLSRSEAPSTRQTQVDRWNRWVFRSQVGGNGSGERSSRTTNVSGSFGANRTTERLKVNLSVDSSYSESRFELPDGQEFISPQRRSGANSLVVHALGERWSAGVRAATSASTFQNVDRAWYVAPAIEYDVFPYAESTRRLLTLQYSAGLRAFDYDAETVFGKRAERRAAQLLSTALTLRQRWGTVSAGLDAASYVPDVKYNHVSGWGSLDLSLFKGFAFSFNGDVSSVRDQLYLPRGEATAEEILVRQRQLATGYQYYYSFGISYTFGSIYSAAVNPRLERDGF
jgi:hypothetical protein